MCLNTCFCLFWSENCAPSVDIVGLLLFSISKKEYLTVQKKNFYKVEELGRESTCAKNAHVPFWNIWIMKERADPVVFAKFANTTQRGAKVVINLTNKNNDE